MIEFNFDVFREKDFVNIFMIQRLTKILILSISNNENTM